MAFEIKPGTVYMFKNVSKKADAHPDVLGDLVLTKSYAAGETLRLAGWLKQTKNGDPYVFVKENTYVMPEGKPFPPANPNINNQSYPKEVKSYGNDDDEVPF